MKSPITITTILTILLMVPPALGLSPATVLSIGDGDTITVNKNGEKVKVRMKQAPFGEAARNQLKTLLPIVTTVTLREIDRDHSVGNETTC